jgi:hypothetical protein
MQQLPKYDTFIFCRTSKIFSGRFLNVGLSSFQRVPDVKSPRRKFMFPNIKAPRRKFVFPNIKFGHLLFGHSLLDKLKMKQAHINTLQQLNFTCLLQKKCTIFLV